MLAETAGVGDKQSLDQTKVEVKEEPGGQDYLQVKEGGGQMRKETMVEVKKEVLAELNVKEENLDVINENEYMEVDKTEIKKEEYMSEREKILQKTVSKLLQKKSKAKDKLKTERRKVKALEQKVEELRTRLQLYENPEQGVVEMAESESKHGEVNEQVGEVQEVVDVVDVRKHEDGTVGDHEEGVGGGEYKEDEGEEEEKGTEADMSKAEQRKPTRNKITVNYNEDQDKEVDDPDYSQDKTLDTSENEAAETSEDEAPPAKKPRRSSGAARAARLPKPAGAKARGFKCQEPGCGYAVARDRCLLDHGRAKHGHPKLVCPEQGCKKAFVRYNSLSLHKKTVHEGLLLKCGKLGCDYTAIKEQQLADHGRAKHDHPKLVCPEPDCDLKFTSYSGLMVHKKTVHQGLLIKCDKCNKVFAYSFQLNLHKTKHVV